jgi:hypothetical protein
MSLNPLLVHRRYQGIAIVMPTASSTVRPEQVSSLGRFPSQIHKVLRVTKKAQVCERLSDPGARKSAPQPRESIPLETSQSLLAAQGLIVSSLIDD